MLWSMRTVCLCAFISRRDRLTRPRRRDLKPSQQVLADKAYDANWIRALICEQGAQAVIPSKSNRKMLQFFDRTTYRERNLVERFFGRLKKSFRRIAPHYEKTASNFMVLIKLASVRLWCEFYESATWLYLEKELVPPHGLEPRTP